MPSDYPCSDCRQDASAKVKVAENLWGCIDKSGIRRSLRLEPSAVLTLRLQVQMQYMLRSQQDMRIVQGHFGRMYIYIYICIHVDTQGLYCADMFIVVWVEH